MRQHFKAKCNKCVICVCVCVGGWGVGVLTKLRGDVSVIHSCTTNLSVSQMSKA